MRKNTCQSREMLGHYLMTGCQSSTRCGRKQKAKEPVLTAWTQNSSWGPESPQETPRSLSIVKTSDRKNGHNEMQPEVKAKHLNRIPKEHRRWIKPFKSSANYFLQSLKCLVYNKVFFPNNIWYLFTLWVHFQRAGVLEYWSGKARRLRMSPGKFMCN